MTYLAGRSVTKAISLILAVVLAMSCNSHPPTPIGSLTEPGVRGLAGLAWLPNGHFVGVTLGADFRYSLVDVDVSTGTMSPRPAPSVGCLIDTVVPRAMPNDRLAFLVSLKGTCMPGVQIWSAASDGSDLRHELDIPVLAGQYFPLPQSNSWIYGFNTGLCAWIASAPSPFAQTLGITVPHDGGAIPLDAAANAPDCDRMMRAGLPTLRADGLLAFLVSSDSPGLGGGSGLDAEWRLYEARAGEQGREIRAGITHPIDLEWDPTGQRLGLTATIDGVKGLWVMDESGKTVLLAAGGLTSVAWSPDGQRIATVREGDDPLEDRDLIVIDLPH
jgi:hypothetical protein